MISNQPAPMIFIATPCFGGSVTTGYMTSVINLLQSAETHGVSVSLNLLGRDSLISRARNTLAVQFMTMKEATHLMFIDADKANYPAYLETALRLLRTGGLAIFDNTLWSGRVLEVNAQSADTRAIQALNRALKDDARVDLSLLPLGDGLTLCRKV